ncbi:glycosyltransferase family 2 protein, partial [Escherichia coli]
YSLLNDGNIIGSISRVVLRKKCFYRAGNFDESLSCLQDYDLWIRRAKVCKIANDKEASVIDTVHESGKQTSSKFKNYENTG